MANIYTTDNMEPVIADPAKCALCGHPAKQRCSFCQQEWYCRRECRVKHWAKHKKVCEIKKSSSGGTSGIQTERNDEIAQDSKEQHRSRIAPEQTGSDHSRQAPDQPGGGSIPKRLSMNVGPQRDKMTVLKDLLQNALAKKAKLEYSLEEEKRNVKDLQEKIARQAIESSHGGSKPALEIPEELDFAANRTEIFWESPFQFAQLSFMAHEKQLAYEVNQYSASLLGKLAELQQSGLFCDVEVTGKGSTFGISCHSLVLCALSSVIKTRMCSSLSCGAKLNFENIPHETMVQFVNFAYTGKIGLDRANVLSVFTAADFLNIGHLTNLALGYLSRNVEKFDVVSCYKVLSFIDQHEMLKPLIPMYKRRVFESVRDVFCSIECLNDLPLSLMVELLESDHVNWGPEMEVLQAVDRWILMDSSREQYVSALLSRIRWDQIEPDKSLLLSGDVKTYANAMKTVKDSVEENPNPLISSTSFKMGSRCSGLTAGILFLYTDGSPSILIDMEARKLKLFPAIPNELLGKRFNILHVVESDDGSFYVIMGKVGRGSTFPPRRNLEVVHTLHRLDLGQRCWIPILDCMATKFISGAVLGGKFCFVVVRGDAVEIDCMNIETAEKEFNAVLDNFADASVSITSKSMYILQQNGSLSRFDQRDCSIRKIQTGYPICNDWSIRYGKLQTNGCDRAVIRVDRTGIYFCLETGRVIRSFDYEGFTDIILLHDSVLYTKYDSAGRDMRGTKAVEIFRDRANYAGWNKIERFSLRELGGGLVLPCHFARATFAALPDFK